MVTLPAKCRSMLGAKQALSKMRGQESFQAKQMRQVMFIHFAELPHGLAQLTLLGTL